MLVAFWLQGPSTAAMLAQSPEKNQQRQAAQLYQRCVLILV